MNASMNAAWQKLTLRDGAPQAWILSSYLHRLVGLLASWQQGSLLMRWSEGLATAVAAILFFLSPFVSTTLIGILMLACSAFWVLLTLSDEGRPGITPMHLAVVVYLAIAFLATALSPVKMAALDGLIILTLNVIVFFLLARVLRSPALRSGLITVYLLTTAVVSTLGMRQWFFGADALATWVDVDSNLAGTTRVYSSLGNPNLLAGYLIAACMLSAAAVFAWKRWLPKALAVVLVLLNSACLVLTFSRGGWIGYVGGGFVFLLLLVHWFSKYLPRVWRRLAIPFVLGISAAFVVAAVVAVDPVRDRVLSIFAGREDSSNNFRLNVWAAVREMIAARPVLGIGPGNEAFNQIYPRFQRTGFTALSAYSVFLEILVETGVIGLMVFLWLLAVTLSLGWRRLQEMRQAGDRDGFWLLGALASMMGMLTHGLVDTVWYRPQISTLWWLMLAIVASYYLFPNRSTREVED